MRIAIVEDEAVVARRLERMVRGFAGDGAAIEVAPSLVDAVEIIRRPLDLLFLDLNLNGRDGFALLEEAAASRFATVVVSAHHDQALRAFDYGVKDFVAKPWSEERLRTAFERATGSAPHGRASKLVIRKGRELRTIDVSEVLYIRGADDYSEVHREDGSVDLHEKSLSALESLLPRDFARVHRSYIANLARVRGVQANAIVLEDGSVIPVGRASRRVVRERLGMPVALSRLQETTNMHDDGFWDQVEGNWKQLKGKVREKWGLLTDDDLEHIAGHKDRLFGKIQEKYGEAKWEKTQIENEMRGLNNPPDVEPRR